MQKRYLLTPPIGTGWAYLVPSARLNCILYRTIRDALNRFAFTRFMNGRMGTSVSIQGPSIRWFQ